MSVKRLICAAVIGLAAVSAGGFAQAAPGDQPLAAPVQVAPEAPAMLVVNYQQIKFESKALKALKNQVDAQQQALQKEFARKDDDLRATQLELQKEQSTTPTDVFQEKVRAFENRVAEVHRDAAQKKQALEVGAHESESKIDQVLTQIIRDIATERQAGLVLDAATLYVVNPIYDATAEAAHRLDARLATVALVVPKNPLPASAGAVPAPDAQGTPPAAPPAAPATTPKRK